MKVMVLHGPNLNMLGKREPDVYGGTSFEELNKKISDFAEQKKINISIEQSNHEGELIELIQNSSAFDYIIFNPGAYTHYSLAIRDAISAVQVPVIEVHISNIYAREDFRQKSVISGVSLGQICGFGVESYTLALEAISQLEK